MTDGSRPPDQASVVPSDPSDNQFSSPRPLFLFFFFLAQQDSREGLAKNDERREGGREGGSFEPGKPTWTPPSKTRAAIRSRGLMKRKGRKGEKLPRDRKRGRKGKRARKAL